MMHVGECSIIGTSQTHLFLNPEFFFSLEEYVILNIPDIF